VWGVEGDEAPHACPNCKAEAGLEPKSGIPLAMSAFGLILGGAIVLALVGTVLGFGAQ
jgi:hypothetical protein